MVWTFISRIYFTSTNCFLLTFYSWRTIWHFISIIIIIVLPLVVFYTIKNITIDSRESENIKNKNLIDIKSWKRSEVLKDFKFYIIALNMLALPWIATGVFIYQSFIAGQNYGMFM